MVFPTEQVTVTAEHTSVAVAVPQPGIEVGLHPRSEPGGHNVNTGASVSTIHVNVCVHVEELPQKSVAV